MSAAAEQLTPPRPRTPVSLHPATLEPLRTRLAEALGRAEFELTDHDAAPVVAPLESVANIPAGRMVVALHSGQVDTPHCDAIGRTPPGLLLACREDGLPAQWELRALRTLLAGSPLLTMAPAPWKAWKVSALADLKEVSEHAAVAAREAGARAGAASRAADVMYEIAANALLDAPVSGDGQPKYAHRRSEVVAIEPSDACRAAVAVEEGRIYLSASDRYGRLTAAPLVRVVCSARERAQLNESGGGAGLGLRRMLEQSDLLAVRVTEGIASEVVCVVDLGDTRRRTTSLKSVFFASVGG
ncbi:MAG: hypothetical protein HYZ28_13930 [Myxococcales bacterium]|nr:hypothetical protein [Myxococcales bacterium]